MLIRCLFVFVLLYIEPQILVAADASPDPATIAAGARIYRDGMLPNGEPLLGERAGGANLTGSAAACTNCHRRSGLGSLEGQIVIPPIIGKYLFNSLEKNVKDMNVPHVYATRVKRSPYNDTTLARAIRDGIDSDGRTLNYLMPHYHLDDANLHAVEAYLEKLTNAAVPGVTDETLHFATIITPDADPATAKAMLEVMEKFIQDKNEFIRGGGKPMVSTARAIRYRVTRRWSLHVWNLQGAADTWQQQLHDKLKAEPVFAVLSGLGGKTWAPIHQFCQAEEIPCLFPNTDIPVDKETDFYSMYFSKGVLLESELIAHDIQVKAAKQKPARIIQVYRRDDIGAAASQALQHRSEIAGIKIVNHDIAANAKQSDINKAIADAGSNDVLVLWLRNADVAALPAKIEKHHSVYVSGTLSGLEDASLPSAWRSTTEMVYPVDLPNQRRVRLYYPLGWFKVRHIAVVNERVQTDTYMACGIASEILNDMLDSFVRDYLLERTEGMLSHRLITGYYPRLGLAQQQRFASKGGYLVHFTEPQGNKIKADTDWVIP